MTPLELEIRNRITFDGPMPIAEYMMLCLTHPEHGYYTTGLPVGGKASADRTGGDFITAPEVSQMFGEMIGVWCMEVWQAIGSPSSFNLIELGPGRGTLMKDLLRVSHALPAFYNAIELHLVEVSPTLSEQQSLTLSGEKALHWTSGISNLPSGPCIVIGNEFIDALPIRQWVKHGENWHERAVGLRNDKLSFMLRPNTLPVDELPAGHQDEPDGMIFETAPAREAAVSTLANHIVENSGAALFIDYGHLESGFGDTLQAIRNHAYADVLDNPGKADLTSHVDFQPLIQTAKKEGCVLPTPQSQGEFLINLGLLERAGVLGSNQNKSTQESLEKAVGRLAGPDQMGDLFKVVAFGAPASLGERWPGFS